MIDYPDDRDVLAQAQALGIPAPVLIRDIVRIVEVLNLRNQNFFGPRRVLAGSMGLRVYGSPRFTVYDADFSTSLDLVDPPTTMKQLLAYEDELLSITPSDLVPHDGAGTSWKSAPITFDPAFTALIPGDNDRSFKADVSFRSLVLQGRELPLRVPYDGLKLWKQPPLVYVMDLHETVAEKVLGWCAHRLVKHYADLGYVAHVSAALHFDYGVARSVLADKLEIMRGLQPDHYEAFPNVEALIDDLSGTPAIATNQWNGLVYVQALAMSLESIERNVRQLMAPALRAAHPAR